MVDWVQLERLRQQNVRDLETYKVGLRAAYLVYRQLGIKYHKTRVVSRSDNGNTIGICQTRAFMAFSYVFEAIQMSVDLNACKNGIIHAERYNLQEDPEWASSQLRFVKLILTEITRKLKETDFGVAEAQYRDHHEFGHISRDVDHEARVCEAYTWASSLPEVQDRAVVILTMMKWLAERMGGRKYQRDVMGMHRSAENLSIHLFLSRNGLLS